MRTFPPPFFPPVSGACFIELCHTELSGSLVKSAQVGSANGRLEQLTEVNSAKVTLTLTNVNPSLTSSGSVSKTVELALAFS